MGGGFLSRWKPYNPNPERNRTIDCTIRAICKATGKDWDTVFVATSVYAFSFKDMQTADYVWGAYLRQLGYKRYLVDDNDQYLYTVEDFCNDNPKGTYILSISGHVVCVQDGFYYDSWDSGKEIPIYYWTKGD